MYIHVLTLTLLFPIASYNSVVLRTYNSQASMILNGITLLDNRRTKQKNNNKQFMVISNNL